jgi:hypothetical protein
MFLGMLFRLDCASGVENFVDHSEANVYLTSIMKKKQTSTFYVVYFRARNYHTLNILPEHNKKSRKYGGN